MITILIPSYNHEAYVLECLKASVTIHIPRLKVLVIDDGSTDETAHVVEKFIADYQGSADVKLIKKNNGGLISSLNMGLSLADTEFFYLVASDDVPDPKGIESSVKILQASPRAKFVIGGAQYFEGENNLNDVYGEKHAKFLTSSSKERVSKLFLDYPQPLLLQSVVFRASVLRDVDGWDPDIILDDYQMFVKLFLLGLESENDFKFRPSLNNVYYRMHGSNSYRNTVRQYSMVREVLIKFCPDEGLSRAIGKVAAYHFLIGIRMLELHTCFRIGVKVSGRQWAWFLIYVIYFVLARVIKRA